MQIFLVHKLVTSEIHCWDTGYSRHQLLHYLYYTKNDDTADDTPNDNKNNNHDNQQHKKKHSISSSMDDNTKSRLKEVYQSEDAP